MLARFAESTFWLGRYMERTDALARLLEVTETHARDDSGSQDWAVILEVNGDLARFQAAYGQITAPDVIRFYTLDLDNQTSMASSVLAARENARGLRHLISTEMWSQINVFHTWFRELRDEDVAPREIATLCRTIKESCQAHTGTTEATFYRDQAWLFYWIGKMIERADQSSRLLDVAFMKAQRMGLADENQGAHLSHWNALLRSVGGYQAYRRTHPVRLRSSEVATFMLLDREFPRAILTCLNEVQNDILVLIDQHGVATAKPALAVLGELRTKLQRAEVPKLMESGLHEFADGIQKDLIDFSLTLGMGCFGHGTSGS